MIDNGYRFLLLTSHLGNPDRKPLSVSQLRLISQRFSNLCGLPVGDSLSMRHLSAIGLEQSLSSRILDLLEDKQLLEYYIAKAERSGCHPITRDCSEYPLILRKRLLHDSPGCLWAKGNSQILNMPKVSLVGSRDLRPINKDFASEVGRQAALQGFALVSGNARGADITAQNACLQAGGYVISVVADNLSNHSDHNRILYLSEEDYDVPFSAHRALSRNRVIHSLGEIVFVAQCMMGKGGTWDGSMRNLTQEWSAIFCFRDGSPASEALAMRGAVLISIEELSDFSMLEDSQISFFE